MREDSNKPNQKQRREITMDTTEIQRVVGEYYEKSYDNKVDKLEEMDKFLEIHNLPNFQSGRNRKFGQTDYWQGD